MKRILLFLVAVMYCCTRLSAQTLDKKFAATNGPVNAIFQKGDTVYIGGDFTQVGTPVNKLARFKKGSTERDINFPQLDASADVRTIASDGTGGFYLGGSFSNFNGKPITPTSVIHVLNDGTMDNNFGVVEMDNSSLTAIKKIGNRLFVGGSFYYIQGVYRPTLAALNATTGALDNWVPDQPNYSLTKIDGNDSVLFIGGYFDRVGNSLINTQIAALSIATGKLLTSFPAMNGVVRGFSVDSSNTLYLGGDFTGLGYAIWGLCSASATNASINTAFPSTLGNVWCIIPDGKDGFYVGGYFSSIGNVSRNNIAHILPNGSIDLRFYVNVNGMICSMVLDGNNLFFAGEFTLVNGIARNNIASVAAVTGSLTNFNPNANNTVTTIAIHGDTVYMGGQFSEVKGKLRNYAAAVTKTNVLTAWAPEANNYVNKIVLNSTGTTAYLGGSFSTIKAKPVAYLAKVNTANGKPYAWNPILDGAVNNLILNGNTLYLRGDFYNINSVSRSNFGAIDTASGKPTTLKANINANYNNGYNDMSISNGKLYVGGSYNSIQDSIRNNIARIDLASGLVDTWNSNNELFPSSAVLAICASQDKVLLGGTFSFLTTSQRNHIAAIDITNNNFTVKNWNPDISFYNYGSINDILHYQDDVFVGGDFQYDADSSGSSWVSMYHLLALNHSTGKISRRFSEYPNASINSLGIFDNKLMISGWFNEMEDASNSSPYAVRHNLASYNLSDFKLSSEKYDPNGYPNIITDKTGNLILAGNFSFVGYVDRLRLASINIKTGLPTDWNPHVEGFVFAMTAQDSVIYIGGNFNSIGTNYEYRYNLAAVNAKTGATLINWEANTDNTVYALAVKDKILYVGGDFTYVNGLNRNYAAAISTTNAGIRNWNPSPDNVVRTLLPLNNSVYLGGYFSAVKGTAHQYLVKVNNTNGNPLAWQPNPDGAPNYIVSSGRNVFVSGAFQQISTKSRSGLAAFDTVSNKLTSFDAKLYSEYFAQVIPLAASGKNIYFGAVGTYQTVGDSARGPLAGVDTATSVALPFNPKPNQGFYFGQSGSLCVGRNKLFAGGAWNKLGDYVSPSYFAVFTLEPQSQSSGLQVSNLQTKSAIVSFTRGGGENRIVVIKQGAQPAEPSDGKSYTANAGYKLGDSTDGTSYVVYNGNGNTVTITKLSPNLSYTVSVYEYNGDGTACDYLTYPVLSATFTTPATVAAQKAAGKENAATALTATRIYPNPVLNECAVTFNAAAKQYYIIDVLDIKGNVLMRKNIQAAKGSNKVTLNTADITAGIYMVSIIDENGSRENLKLVKQ